ncbi:MAG: DUF2064 domain-containing protein [Saprospiraceae bacterium]
MTLSVPNTAILLFIRNEKEEAKQKRLASHRDKLANQRIIKELNQHALQIAQQTDLPVFVCTGKEQHGANFGEKLANAIESIFQKGYQKVITIGNDCLSLTATDLIKANEQLLTQDIVLGPTPEGGVYLIGLNKAAYQRSNFLKLRWESPYLFHDFCCISSANSIYILSKKADVNDGTTFQKAFNQLQKKHILRRRLSALIKSKSTHIPTFQNENFTTSLHYSQIYFRGPPQ